MIRERLPHVHVHSLTLSERWHGSPDLMAVSGVVTLMDLKGAQPTERGSTVLAFVRHFAIMDALMAVEVVLASEAPTTDVAFVALLFVW